MVVLLAMEKRWHSYVFDANNAHLILELQISMERHEVIMANWSLMQIQSNQSVGWHLAQVCLGCNYAWSPSSPPRATAPPNQPAISHPLPSPSPNQRAHNRDSFVPVKEKERERAHVTIQRGAN